jgi:hypothetical protein
MLPAMALIVCDAGYIGFELCRQIMASNADLLIRMSSVVTLYTERAEPLTECREGIVDYCPEASQKRGDAPLRLRLLRVVGKWKDGHSYDVWMLTSVLSKRRLPLARASQWRRWRWANEGYFRAYKRTLRRIKLTSRTAPLVHREAEGSMLAVQLLLATTAKEILLARRAATKASPRHALLEYRREFLYLAPRRRREPLGPRLARAIRELRPGRTSPKATRIWPRRGPHKPPKPPKILTLDKLKRPLQPAFQRPA